MLLCNYKPTCFYSFTIALPSRHKRTARRTLSYRLQSAHREFAFYPTTAKMPTSSLVTRHLRPRILHRRGLALIDSSIQSP